MPEFDPNPVLPAVGPSNYPTNTMDVDRALLAAQGDVKDANLDRRPPVFDKREDTGLDTFASSWRTGTSVGALASSNFLAELMAPTSDSPAMTASEAYDRATREGLGVHADRIAPYAATEALYNALAADARREEEDKKSIAASGKMGHAIGLAAGLTDPVNYIPVAGVAARAARVGSLSNTMLRAAEAGLVSTAASEAIQQGASVTKTPGESVLNVATGTLFSAVLGGALHKMIGPEAAAKVEATQERALNDTAMTKEVKDHLAAARDLDAATEQKSFLDRALEIERDAEALSDRATKSMAERFSSGGAGSTLTKEQRSEVLRIAKQYPDMDQTDIIDSVLASHGELSIGKIRPGFEHVFEKGEPTEVRAADLEARVVSQEQAVRSAQRGEGFDQVWNKSNVPGTTPIQELLKLVPMHLKGKVSYSDIAEHLTEKFSVSFTRGSVASAVSRLRDKGAIGELIPPTPPREKNFTFEPVVTPENVEGWLRSAGIKDIKIEERGADKTKYLTFTDPERSLKNAKTYVRIPTDAAQHPGRGPKNTEKGGGRLDTASGVGNDGRPVNPLIGKNASGGAYADWNNLIDALKFRLSRSPDGQFLVPPGQEPVPRVRPEPTQVYTPVKNPDKQLDLDYGVDHIKAAWAAKAQSAGAAGVPFQGLVGTPRLDARFLGLPIDSMLKNANKSFTSAPFRGVAGVTAKAAEWLGIPAKTLRQFADNPVGENIVSQGMRNIRLAAQDSESPAFRTYIQQTDINPWYTKSDAAGVVQHGDLNFPDEHRKLYVQWTEATRNADELWRKNRGELKNADGSPMDRETYADAVYFANIQDGKADNPLIASAAKGYRKFYDAVEQKLVDAKLLDADKKLRNAETYGTINYLPDAVRNDREAFIRQHAQDFTNRFEADYGKALITKRDNDRVNKSASDAIDQQLAEKSSALLEGRNNDITQRREEHATRLQQHTEDIAQHREVLKADKSDELQSLSLKLEEKRQAASQDRAAELQSVADRADARGSKDASLVGGMSDHSARRIEDTAQARSDKQLATDQARVEKAYEAKITNLGKQHELELKKIERHYAQEETKLVVEDTRKRQDLKKRLDDELAAEHDAHKKAVEKEKERADKEKEKFEDLMSEYDRNILRLNTPERRAAKGQELGEHLYDSVTNNPSGILMESDLPKFRGFGQVLKGRSTATSQLVQAKAGWIDTNIFRSAESYMRKAGTGAAMAQVLKTERDIPTKLRTEGGPTTEMVGDMGGMGVRRNIIADYDDLIRNAAEDGKTELEKQLTTKKAQAVSDFDAHHDMVLGNHGGGQNSINLGKVGPLIQHYNNWRFMGGTVVASLTDPANAIAAHGLGNSMKFGFIPAAKNFKAAWANVAAEDLPDMYRILQMTGASIEHVVNARLAAATDLVNPVANKALTGADYASKQFWRISGLAGWTTLMKDIGGTITHGRIITASQKGWDNLSLGERTWLTNLKIGAEDLSRVEKMYAEQIAAGHGTSAGIPYGRTQDLSVEGRGDYKGWSDREIADKFDNAVYRESHNVAVTPTAGDKLALTATPIGRMLWQYRNFGVAMTARVMGRNAALAGIDDASRMNFYSGVVSMAALAGLVDFTKTVLGEATGVSPFSPSKNFADMSAADVWAKKWQEDPGAQMYKVLDRSAILWPVTEASNVLHTMGLPNIEQGVGKLTGDKSAERSGRFAQRGVVEAALGPSVGLLTDIPGALGQMSGAASYGLGWNPDFSIKKSDYARDRRLLPLQNTVPFQQLMNYGHKYMGTVWDWPEPR